MKRILFTISILILTACSGSNLSNTASLKPPKPCPGHSCHTTTTTTTSSTIASTTTIGTTTTTTIATTTTTKPTTTTTTITPTTTSTTTTTTLQTTTTVPSGTYFTNLPVKATLPSESTCASLVKPRAEIRHQNAIYNATRGTDNGAVLGVSGNYTGTTDEIIQWAACKWGIDEDWVRAQAATESYWDQAAKGDYGNDPSACYPAFSSPLPCPQSIGIVQVRYPYHLAAFTDSNAVKSTAYNLDYLYSIMRSCYNGDLTWLNTVDRGWDYTAGDMWGCFGVWFSGRWHTQAANDYITFVQNYLNIRVWEKDYFLAYDIS